MNTFQDNQIDPERSIEELVKFTMIEECPVFYPTIEEFNKKSFSDYVLECEKKVDTKGIFKVVAPKEWNPRKEGYSNLNLNVNKPIEQNVHGTKGIYELVNFI